MKSEIFWKNPGYKTRPELKEDIECEYLIVGGGVTGVSAAYFLAKGGAKNIVLIEKKEIASGATGMAAGTLVLRGETDLLDLLKTHSKKEAISYWQGIHDALNGMRKLIEKENIDCDAESQDTLYCGFQHRPSSYIKREYEAEISVEKTTKFLVGEDLKRELNTLLFTGGILSSLHGLSVNPLKFTQNLSVALEKYGVKIYENTALLDLSKNSVKTKEGNIKYKKLIMAIDADDRSDEVKTQKTTIAITRPLTKEELVKTGLIRKKIVWDSRTKYDYFKVTKENRILFGFGTTIVRKRHRKTEPRLSHLKHIRNFSKRLFPYLDLDLEYAWAGNFGVTKNYEPLIIFKKNMVSISGAGSQVVCYMAAEHIVNKLLGKKSSADKYF